ncbi:MAG: lysylphosphatidylglycerol synthase transmembrane domain-containing protein [Halobacteriales archaeon]
MRRELSGLVVGVVLVVAVLLLLDVRRVAENVARARTDLFLLALASGLAGVLLLGLALWQLRRALETATAESPVRYFGAFLRAYFVRLIIPIGASGAPAIYAYVLHREFGTEFEEEFAVGTAAELLNYGASAGVALAGLLLFTVDGGVFAYSGPLTAGIGAVLVGVAAAFAVLWYAPAAIDRVVLAAAAGVNRTLGRLSRRVRDATADERVRRRLGQFHETTALLGRAPRTMAACTAITVLAWLALSAPLYLAVLALEASVPFALVLVAVPVSGFMYVLPVSGGLGGVEVAVGTILVAGTGLSIPLTAAAVLLYRLATYWVPVFVTGLATVVRPADLPTDI